MTLEVEEGHTRLTSEAEEYRFEVLRRSWRRIPSIPKSSLKTCTWIVVNFPGTSITIELLSLTRVAFLIAEVRPTTASGGPPAETQLQLFGLADVVAWGYYPSKNLGFSEHFGFCPYHCSRIQARKCEMHKDNISPPAFKVTQSLMY